MAREAPEIRLIRETLEGVVHPTTASTMLFQALQEHGGAIPKTYEEILALVEGPLNRQLTERVGADMAESVLDQLRMMLASIGSAGRQPRKRPSRHDEPTRSVELSSETLPVFVLSASRTFAEKLSAALGPHIMTTVLATDALMLADRLDQIAPAFVLVDGSDFPAIEPDGLCRKLSGLPDDLVKAIWGADLPYGMSVLASGQSTGVRFTPFDRREGIAPLLDIIRSRRAQS